MKPVDVYLIAMAVSRGVEADDLTSADLVDDLDELEAAHPKLAPVLKWARCGVCERSGDLLRDGAQLLLDARALVGVE